MRFNKCAEKINSEKKLKIVQDQEIQNLSLRLIDCFSFDFESFSIDLCYDISLAKLMKESNTIVNQID
jgi:antirestriction protein